jgi:LTXXQ motif family protein
MKRTVCAGVFAFAIVGLLSSVSLADAREIGVNADFGQTSAVINIVRIKSVLKLTPAQEQYWTPVEAALRDLVRRQAHADEEGLVRRISNRVISVVLNSAAVQRLAVAVRPLIAVLDDEQKRAAYSLVQEMGLSPVVAAQR